MNALVKNHCRSFAIIIVLFCYASASAQLSANFTATPRSGCSPLVVYFNDQSTGNPVQWKWDLGNGVISTLKNPSATYFNAGSYTIKLIVRNSNGSDSIVKTQYIIVHPNPVVNFTASDTAGCAPLSVQFTDNSVASEGTIVSRQWDFGDGSISSQQNPSHVYTTAGNYNVTLKVTNSFGCTKTLTRIQHIKISSGTVAGFTNNMPSLCAAPVSIQFTNTSTGPGNMTYTWDFGDGSSDTGANPIHNYTSNGSYTVSMIAVSAQGCRDTIKKINLFPVGNNHANFSAPLIVCVGSDVHLTNTSSPLPSATAWNFGNGNSSPLSDPVINYSSPGTYTIRLVSDFNGCTDSASKQITVLSKPSAVMNASDSVFCKTPATVQFQSTATGAVSQLWIFGDGTTATAANPTHNYSDTGSYTVKLIVTNASGCSDTLIKNNFIQVHKPVIRLIDLPRTGCVPLMANPSASVVSSQNVQSYLWNFGDGTSSIAAHPSHTYSSAGNYNVSLSIVTTGGCTDSITMINGVRAGNKPHANFTYTPGQVCNSFPVSFTDSSTGNVDQWLWDFEDTSTDSTQNPVHQFNDIGTFSVSLVVWSNTCPDTIRKINIIHVLPPTSAFTVQNNCADKLTKSFTDHSFGATTLLWSFGDGTTSTQQNPVHTYQSPGIYYVSLAVSNGMCTNSNGMNIKVMDEKAVIAANHNLVCKGTAVQFSAPLAHPVNIATWYWNFGDGNTFGDSLPPAHIYNLSGTFTAQLIITDKLGCKDSATTDIKVYGPVAGFYPGNNAVCLTGNNILFSDTSNGDGIHPLVKWTWNYGDGTIDSTSASPFYHHYTGANEYNVKLKITDSFGCSDSATLSAALIIAQPHAMFYAPDSLSCTNKNISFVNQSTGYNLQYHWNFGDGTQNTTSDPQHIYPDAGAYPVALVVTDSYGCKDSLIKPNYINISLPKAGFIVSDSVGTCPPLMVHFTSMATGYAQMVWDFGDGNTSSLQNPSHYYNTPGVFYAKQIITANGGCTDTAVQKITVKGPNGTFSYSPLTGCNPHTVSFTASTQNAASFVWDFSDGNILATDSLSVSHTYTAPGEFVPKIILTDAGGCNVPIFGTDTIRVYGITAAFTASGNKFCTEGTVQFTNNTISNDYITSYEWNFGDGTTSDEQTPSHNYNIVGEYSIQLIAATQNGCRDTFALPDSVRILKAPSIEMASDVEACVPAVVSFDGIVILGNTGQLIWDWDFSNGSIANTQHPVVQTYTTAGSYTVTAIATARDGCKDTATRTITIHPLPVTNAGADVWVCRGSSIQLNATGANYYVWNSAASLSCDSCSSPLSAPSDSVRYVVTGFNSFGCSNKDSITVRVHQPFTLKTDTGDTICVGSSAHLRASGADIYSWSPANGLQNPNNAATLASPINSTTYQVIAKDINNCFSDTASVFIKVWPLPIVSAGADAQVVVGDALQLTATGSADVISWQWNNGGSLSCATCATTLAKPKQATTYTVTVKNGGGCSAKDDVTVSVICNGGNLLMPNTFSPNGDGINDRFYPGGKGINMIRSLKIFNRWGEVVFERNNFSANDAAMGWDGMYKGQLLSSDVYIYACDVVCQNNEVLSFKGDVTLLR